MLKTWASRTSVYPAQLDDGDIVMDDAEMSPEKQVEELRECMKEFAPRIEGNAWVQKLLATL